MARDFLPHMGSNFASLAADTRSLHGPHPPTDSQIELDDLRSLINSLVSGGYLARASDPLPGSTVIWRGMARLADIELGFSLRTKNVGKSKVRRVLTLLGKRQSPKHTPKSRPVWSVSQSRGTAFMRPATSSRFT